MARELAGRGRIGGGATGAAAGGLRGGLALLPGVEQRDQGAEDADEKPQAQGIDRRGEAGTGGQLGGLGLHRREHGGERRGRGGLLCL